MKTFLAAICQPNQPPPPDCSLVVFSGAHASTIRKRDPVDFLAQAASYAAAHQVCLVPGLFVKDGCLCLSLFDDQGQLILEQPAAHLNPSWAGDLRRGDEIHTIETPLGCLALCVDVDIYKSEVARIAALQGAEIMVSCQLLRPEDNCRELVLAGPWQQAQQNCLYILNASNLHAAIIGPCITSADRSGFLVDLTDQYPLQAELSAEKRAAAYQGFPVIKSLNPRLYQRHAAELCK